MKRSDDAGRSWYPPGGQIVVPEGYDESAVFDAATGAVTLLFPKQPVPGSDVANATNARRASTDLGRSWDAVAAVDLGAFNGSLVGPGRGLQLRGGPHAGRLLFAVHHGEGDLKTAAWKRSNTIVISDTGGRHWRRGATLPGMDEAQLAKLARLSFC